MGGYYCPHSLMTQYFVICEPERKQLFGGSYMLLYPSEIIPDLGVMWDGMAITFAKMGLRDFFLMQKGPSMYS